VTSQSQTWVCIWNLGARTCSFLPAFVYNWACVRDSICWNLVCVHQLREEVNCEKRRAKYDAIWCKGLILLNLTTQVFVTEVSKELAAHMSLPLIFFFLIISSISYYYFNFFRNCGILPFFQTMKKEIVDFLRNEYF